MMDKVIRKETRINFKNDVLFTGRFKNDTISELLIIRENNYFEYIVSVSPFTRKLTHGYGGLYENWHDSIFLYFYKKYQPLNMASYLIIDSVKKVVAFPYADGFKSKYLDIKFAH
jgi:hypothetical protein